MPRMNSCQLECAAHKGVIILRPSEDLRVEPFRFVQAIRLLGATEVVQKPLAEWFEQQLYGQTDWRTQNGRCYGGVRVVIVLRMLYL